MLSGQRRQLIDSADLAIADRARAIPDLTTKRLRYHNECAPQILWSCRIIEQRKAVISGRRTLSDDSSRDNL